MVEENNFEKIIKTSWKINLK